MEFLGEPNTSRGVVERRFDVKGADGIVPGLVWTPEGATGARPLVLIGHGGTSNKRAPYVLSLARRLVRHQGWAAAAIDAPFHGERVDAPAEGVDNGASGEAGIRRGFLKAVAAAADTMTADWQATLAGLRELDEVGDGPLGYWGVSMGTMLGAPFVAATPEVRCAVLGLMGTFDDADPWATAASVIECPVLFLAQLDDELVAFDSAVTLFRSIGSSDKRMHAHPGLHSAVPVEEYAASEAFLAQHLT